MGVTVGLTKWLAYHHGDDADVRGPRRPGGTDPRPRADLRPRTTVSGEHEREVADFWKRSEVVWDGGRAAQQALHFNLFTMLQASMSSEGYGVPAKGLTGTGYEGHYFWDTEAYLLPFLIHTSPAVARSLLMHRVRMLPEARRRAREVGCAGALFPWRTINGEEASANYAAGTAQYHIDADIAYALNTYVDVTGDTDLLFGHGVELLVETARMWAGLGFFSERKGGKFVIHKVTGPGRVLHRRRQQPVHQPDGRREPQPSLPTPWPGCARSHRRTTGDSSIASACGTTERRAWRRAAEQIYVPFDEQARRPPPGRPLPRAGAVGLRRHTAGPVPTPAALPPSRHLPPPGHQAG